MIDAAKLLYEICEDERVFDPAFDLVESGVLDSYTLIEFLSNLEDVGIVIQPTRIDRTQLKTSGSIQVLIEQAQC